MLETEIDLSMLTFRFVPGVALDAAYSHPQRNVAGVLQDLNGGLNRSQGLGTPRKVEGASLPRVPGRYHRPIVAT